MAFKLGVLRVVIATSFVGIPIFACGGSGTLPSAPDLDGGNLDANGLGTFTRSD